MSVPVDEEGAFEGEARRIARTRAQAQEKRGCDGDGPSPGSHLSPGDLSVGRSQPGELTLQRVDLRR